MGKATRLIAAVCGIVVLSAAGAAAQTLSPLGVWLAKGETGGRGHVRIYKCGAKLCGKLIWSTKAKARDTKNPDESKRSRMVVGSDIVWGFVPDGKNEWDSGRIYDPSAGKTYKAIMRLKGPNLLHVRGYVGISLIGKTQIWTRVR